MPVVISEAAAPGQGPVSHGAGLAGVTSAIVLPFGRRLSASELPASPYRGVGMGKGLLRWAVGTPGVRLGPGAAVEDTVGPRLHLRETLRFMRIYSFTVFTNHKHIHMWPKVQAKTSVGLLFPFKYRKNHV